jgi:hypothetical protein
MFQTCANLVAQCTNKLYLGFRNLKHQTPTLEGIRGWWNPSLSKISLGHNTS